MFEMTETEIREPQTVSGWLDAADFGASGSEFAGTGKITAGSRELVLENAGDFRTGQWITAEGCFLHHYGMVSAEGMPYLACNQKPLENELEIRGNVTNPRNWQTFVLHFHGGNPGTFSWLAVDPRYQKLSREDAAVKRFWQWQGNHLPISDGWIPLADGVELQLVRKEWTSGAVVSFHVRNRLLAKIESVCGNMLVLNREANFTAENSTVMHHDQFALQACLDRAVSERKGMRIPSGRFRLSTGLWVCDTSAVIEGAGAEFTTIDVSGAHTSAFWGGGGREFILRHLAVVGNAGFEILPTNRPFITDSGFAFWPTANQQMETFGSAALNIVGTEFILCEDLAVSKMASEAFYLHGSDRSGRLPFIQAEHEGMKSIENQYTKQCVFRRCRVFDCGFNAFNNNDFAENTIISECHVENVGNFCENASRFTRVTGNYVFNAHTLSLCAIRSPEEFTGISQAIVSNNVFEGGHVNLGMTVMGDEVIVSGNTFTGFSKETAVSMDGASKVVFVGNIVDLTHDSGNPDHQRDGVSVTGNCVIIADNQIGARHGPAKGITGIALNEISRNVIVHDNIFRNCEAGIRSGMRTAKRTISCDMTSCHWAGLYEPLHADVLSVSEDGMVSAQTAEYLLTDRILEGPWIVFTPGGDSLPVQKLSLTEGRVLKFSAPEGTVSAGMRLRIRPVSVNWKIHDNLFLNCEKETHIDFSDSSVSVRT